MLARVVWGSQLTAAEAFLTSDQLRLHVSRGAVCSLTAAVAHRVAAVTLGHAARQLLFELWLAHPALEASNLTRHFHGANVAAMARQVAVLALSHTLRRFLIGEFLSTDVGHARVAFQCPGAWAQAACHEAWALATAVRHRIARALSGNALGLGAHHRQLHQESDEARHGHLCAEQIALESDRLEDSAQSIFSAQVPSLSAPLRNDFR